MRFRNRYVCLEYLPFLADRKDRCKLVSNIWLSNNPDMKDLPGFLKTNGMDDPGNAYYCGHLSDIRKEAGKPDDCSAFIRKFFEELPRSDSMCAAMCSSCILNPRSGKAEEENEWKYISALYHDGSYADRFEIDKKIKTSQFFIFKNNDSGKPVFFKRNITNQLSSTIRSMRSLLNFSLEEDVLFLTEKLSSVKRGQLPKENYRKELSIQITEILHADHDPDSTEQAIAMLLHGSRKTPPKAKELPGQQSIFDICGANDEPADNTVEPAAVSERSAEKNEKETAPSEDTSADSKLIARQAELLRMAGINVPPENTAFKPEAKPVLSNVPLQGNMPAIAEEKTTVENPEGKPEPEVHTADPGKTDPSDEFRFSTDTERGIVLKSADMGFRCTSLSSGQLSSLFSYIYNCRFLACETAILDGKPGIFLFENGIFPMPVFIGEDILSKTFFVELLNTDKFCVITSNYELLCELSQKFGFYLQGKVASLSAAVRTTTGEDNIYPYGYILRLMGKHPDGILPSDFGGILACYTSAYAKIINTLFDQRKMSQYRYSMFYEYALSSANRMSECFPTERRNLMRSSFLQCSFSYNPGLKKKERGTVISLMLKYTGGTEPSENFRIVLLSKIFKRDPFDRIPWILLYLSDEEVIFFIWQTNRDSVNYILERLGTAVADTCKAFHHSSPVDFFARKE